MTSPYVPQIAVFNQASTPLPFVLADLVKAMQVYVDDYIYPVWGSRANLVETQGPIKGQWSLVFLDDADQPRALAYHDEEAHQPVSYVFVKTILDDEDDVAVAATHELAEMLVDAPINRYASAGDQQTMFAYEVCDPVEDTFFQINGMNMSNFVLPSYFEPDPLGQTRKFDHMGVLLRPFSLTEGGYVIITRAGEFRQVFGSKAKEAKRAAQDRRGHRSEQRIHDLTGQVETSPVVPPVPPKASSKSGF